MRPGLSTCPTTTPGRLAAAACLDDGEPAATIAPESAVDDDVGGTGLVLHLYSICPWYAGADAAACWCTV